MIELKITAIENTLRCHFLKRHRMGDNDTSMSFTLCVTALRTRCPKIKIQNRENKQRFLLYVREKEIKLYLKNFEININYLFFSFSYKSYLHYIHLVITTIIFNNYK